MGTVIPAPLTCGVVELNEIKGVNCLGVFSFFILCAPKPQWEHQEELRFFQFPTCWESTEKTKHKLDSAVCPRQWEPKDPRTQSIPGALSLGWQFQLFFLKIGKATLLWEEHWIRSQEMGVPALALPQVGCESL
ncbi:unnamed protein product [Rangifer tarandus platyrhynchus]|uniref:Uncharacterized protein n=1 Tax=Rangifer tarandus platyrhynchus TaxID=3082113 RepID=A0ABN8YUB2_RANTA|nr:unnamed protein product [Rangifer tarandus platyrhynchus]